MFLQALPDSPALARGLAACARTSPNDELLTDLVVLDADIKVEGTKVLSHCYALRVDANGEPRLERLIEHIVRGVIEYAIPRSSIEEATRFLVDHKLSSKLLRLHDEAKRLFVDLTKTGEGGELLLFLLAERVLQIPQILCKMSLKTTDAMHYNGSDGVHASVDPETGVLSLFWCESKMFEDPTSAITDCFNSLAPFLNQPDSTRADRDRDIVLLGRQVDLNNPIVERIIKRYFDQDKLDSTKVKYCGIALVGYNSDAYPQPPTKAIQDELHAAIGASLAETRAHVRKRILDESLSEFDIHVLLVPLPSVATFRKLFLAALGHG